MCQSPGRKVSRGSNRKKCIAVQIMHQDAGETKVSTKDVDVARLKVFNFHSVRSVIIAKLKTKSNQKMEMCEYK